MFYLSCGLLHIPDHISFKNPHDFVLTHLVTSLICLIERNNILVHDEEGQRGSDRMILEFTRTYATSSYHDQFN
jgi:hypothetical protein